MCPARARPQAMTTTRGGADDDGAGILQSNSCTAAYTKAQAATNKRGAEEEFGEEADMDERLASRHKQRIDSRRRTAGKETTY